MTRLHVAKRPARVIAFTPRSHDGDRHERSRVLAMTSRFRAHDDDDDSDDRAAAPVLSVRHSRFGADPSSDAGAPDIA